jgi:hypothetical protein
MSLLNASSQENDTGGRRPQNLKTCTYFVQVPLIDDVKEIVGLSP